MPAERALFEACRGRLQALLDSHAAIDEVERTIEAFPLSTEQQCALWLWAWPRLDVATDQQNPERRRQALIERLTALGG